MRGAPIGNKYAIGNKGGRPPKYSSPKAMAKKIDEYFVYVKGLYKVRKVKIIDPDSKNEAVTKETFCVREPEPVTVTGLALYLGFVNRAALDDYQSKPEFSNIIRRARTRVEHEYEKKLHQGAVTGPVFALKNMGWKDKSEVGYTDNDGNDVRQTGTTVIIENPHAGNSGT